MRSIARIVLGLSSVALMTVVAAAVGTPPDITADVVFGQPDFATVTLNTGGVSGRPTAQTLWGAGGVALDRDGNLYVADTANNRVLFFDADSFLAGTRPVATRVYGQNEDFTTNVSNFGSGPGMPTTAKGLSAPEGVALDSRGNLYVADRGNNRVLFYPADSTIATRSYGQDGSLTSNSINHNNTLFAPEDDSLYAPFSVALDQDDNLYIADSQNNRVVVYEANDNTRVLRVYGQPDYTTRTVVSPPTEQSLNTPWGVAVDNSGDLYVADRNNSRVLVYQGTSTTPSRVYGQRGSFTTGTPGSGNDKLSSPEGVALDRYGNLYVADRGNNRVLFFPAGTPPTATQVYGQAGFTVNDAGPNRGGSPSAITLSAPKSVGVDRMGNLFVADHSNNRVLEFYRVPDTSAPTASPAPSVAANASGWNNTNVTVTWNWTDEEGGTGIDEANCEVSTTTTAEGAALTLGATCQDLAGNEATASYSLKIDRTPPGASAAQSPAANAAGWNNTNVTVAWNWSDEAGGAGIDAAGCTTSSTSSGEGNPLWLSAGCSDLADNSASELYSVKVDKTPPASAPAQSPAANAAGWNNSDVTVTWNWSDTGSGLGATVCPSSTLSSGEGSAVAVSGGCLDVAGNSGSSAISLKVDKTPPSVSLVGGPVNGQTYSPGSLPAAPTCVAADALSGLAGPCEVSGYSTAIGTHTVSARAADNAGNPNSASVTYDVAAAGSTISGFYTPVDMGDVWNLVKAGATVPLKFEVFNGPTELTDPSIVNQLKTSETSCTSGPSDDIELLATGSTTLRYDTATGQFIYNWQTPKKPGYCYVVSVTTTDGSMLSAKFRLK
jgi:sugar lactone lactonase YvrE